MSTAEEFILIPKNQFIEEKPYSLQTVNDPRNQHTAAQFSFLSRMRPFENTNNEKMNTRNLWIQGKQLIPLS